MWLAAARCALTLTLALTLAGCSGAGTEACGDVGVCEPGAACFGDACDVDQRCRLGLEARLYGRSAASAGGCIAADDDGCRRSELTCTIWGQCSAPPADWAAGGSCPSQESDRDYQASLNSACTGAGTCIAASDRDCRASHVCRLAGRCHALGGVCRAEDASDCTASRLCRDAGRCNLQAGRCVAQSASDCEGTGNCETLGQCGYKSGRCVRCSKAPTCARLGLCVAKDGRCQATKQEHCRRSVACRRQGRCKLVAGRCA